MKYRVTLMAAKISDPDRKVEVVAVSAENALEIVKMRYKKYAPLKAVRIGNAPSTVQTMNDIRSQFITALDEGNKELASRHEKAFYGTVLGLQREMDVVAFTMAKKHIPSLPPLGK